MLLKQRNIKHLLLILLIGVTVGKVNSCLAQELQAGDYAPDFTVTDINGNSHSLYDYLNQGKMVVLDFSTTWCSPCWTLHESHILQDAYDLYGPNGSDEIMVLWVECDVSTGMESLLGQTQYSQGNWINGTSYPILNNEDAAMIADSYGILGYPTVMYICPSREVVFNSPWSNVSVSGIINSAQSCSAPTADLDLFLSNSKIESTCEATFDVECTFVNNGIDTISNAVFELQRDGSTISTVVWNGSLPSMQSTTVTFSGVQNNYTNSDYAVIAQMPGDTDSSNDQITTSIDNTVLSSEQIVTVELDISAYPEAVGFDIISSNEDTIYQADFGDLVVGLNSLTIDLGIGCYSFKITDTYSGFVQYYKIKNESTGQEILNVPGVTGIFDNHLLVSGSLGIEEKENSPEVYPTMTENIVNIVDFQKSIELISVYSLTGDLMLKKNMLSTKETISLEKYDKGIYIVLLEGKNGTFSTKVLLQ